jgi:hypothetical protein
VRIGGRATDAPNAYLRLVTHTFFFPTDTHSPTRTPLVLCRGSTYRSVVRLPWTLGTTPRGLNAVSSSYVEPDAAGQRQDTKNTKRTKVNFFSVILEFLESWWFIADPTRCSPAGYSLPVMMMIAGVRVVQP